MSVVEKCPGLAQPALFHALSGKRSVLIAGCGGGYDVYSGIPLYAALRKTGINVHLANLTFTNLDHVGGRRLNDYCVVVAASDAKVADPQEISGAGRGLNYFPEYYLSKFFLDVHGWDVPIYTFDRGLGAKQLADSYNVLAKELSLDAIVIVDGGTDSLMFGDEEQLGTPIEDSTSIAAVHSLKIPSKLLLCLGFGIDHFHGVCHHHFLENTARLTQSGAFLGAFSITHQTPEGQMLLAAYDFVAKLSQDSIVCSSVCNAMRGKFGNVQASPRTAASELYINPLMSMYWCYQLDAVATLIPHMTKLMQTESRTQVASAIQKHRGSLSETRPAKSLPL